MSSVSSLNSLLSSSSAGTSSGINLSSLLTAATGATSIGIDVNAAVDAAIYAARAPERQWQAQQNTIQSQITALTSVQSALSTMSADLDKLNDPAGALSSRTVSSSDPGIVGAAADASATPGTHTIAVQHLATSASWYSSPLTSASASVGSSTLTVTKSDGTQTSFAFGSGGLTSLSAVAKAITSSSLGVTASVVTDAIGSRLALVSQSSGTASNFTVSVGASAPSSSWSSASVASSSATLDASSLQVSDGTSSATIAVAAGSTLADVANQINGAGLNLSASLVSDGSGVHLSIASTNGNNLTVGSDPTLVLTQPTTGSDASLTVDGVPVKSASNSVTGAIAGVTLTLEGVNSGSPTTLKVSSDATQISSVISQFVTDYNSALSLVNGQFTYNPASSSQGILGSDAAIRSLQSTLLSIGAYTPSSASAGSPSSLASLGISVNDDGSLSLDSGTLNRLVVSNASGVQDFFQGVALDGFASTVKAAVSQYTTSTGGILTSDIANLTQQYSDLGNEVNQFESGYIASQQTLLTAMYSKAEIALQQLPTTMKQLQAEFGNGNSGS